MKRHVEKVLRKSHHYLHWMYREVAAFIGSFPSSVLHVDPVTPTSQE
jgi:hypothetical protein